MVRPFAHLHGHSDGSLQDAVSDIDGIVNAALRNEQSAIAVTDHGVMYRSLEQFKKCIKKGIKPIIGVEAYICKDRLNKSGRNTKDNPNRTYHVILLAMNNVGYRNIVKMTSTGHIEGMHYKPRIDHELLHQHREGVIVLSACLGGEINGRLLAGDYDGALRHAQFMADMMGKDNYFLELQDHGIELQHQCNEQLRQISRETGLHTVVTNDFHYCEHGDWKHHCAHVTCGQGNLISDGKYVYDTKQFWIKSSEEMWDLFGKTDPQALENTAWIAERCNVMIEMGQYKLPDFPIPDGETIASYMRKLVFQGLEMRGFSSDPDYVERLKYELNVIEEMGFPGYFLIVSDYIAWARSKGIPVGPGRGSAAGSLVAYCLEITDVDPIQYKLLFERFLNPSRVSMPDIDVDFCIERRHEVVEYVAEKYGYDRVAKIGTFNTLGVKAAIKDVGRVMGLPFAETNAINKLVPPPVQGVNPTFTDVLQEGTEIQKLCDRDPRLAEVVEVAKRLGPNFVNGKTVHGVPKSVSEHAAGVIISRDPIDMWVPVREGKGSRVLVTAWPMNDCEELGLLKMDFLGIRNLTVEQRAVEIILKCRGVAIDIRKLPLDDSKVFKMLSEGDVLGVFQLEASSGMAGICRKIAPSSLEDLCAILALYRPGPMGSGIMDDFINRKNGLVEWDYFDPRIEDFTSMTYGCMIYQEQVMQAVVSLCGYTLPEADNLRKIMGKKLVDKIASEKLKITAGAIEHGMDEVKAQKLADDIEKFASYGFNKSHSLAYAKITYETAWLKANYPVEYMAALLSSVAGKHARVQGYINNCKDLNIDVLPPDVNFSDEDFTAVGRSIRFGLNAIKDVGGDAIAKIVEIRKLKGEFTNLNDFYQKVGMGVCNAKTMKSLIECGALDSIEKNRAALLEQYPLIVAAYKEREKKNKKQAAGQTVLFPSLVKISAIDIPLPETAPFDRLQELASEKALMGVYVSGHPLETYKGLVGAFTNVDLSAFNTSSSEEAEDGIEVPEVEEEQTEKPKYESGMIVSVAGILAAAEKKTTKKNQTMMVGRLENMDGAIKVVFFPRTFEDYGHLLGKDARITIIGKLKIEDGAAEIHADRVMNLDGAKVLKVEVKAGTDINGLYGVKSVGCQGTSPVVFSFEEYPGRYVVAHPNHWVDGSSETRTRLEKLCPGIHTEFATTL